MSLSTELSNKSIQAAISAIEIYNKPDFNFREEAFSLLLVNAWELLLKAKWLNENNEDMSSLYVYDDEEQKIPRLNRSKNPITHSIVYLLSRMLEDENSGLKKPSHDNILALIEIRDNSAHFLNKDIYFGRKILEIGTASLKNYVQLSTEWFQTDLSMYNFYLMPISFYHGFETVEPITDHIYPEQVKHLLAYLDSLDSEDEDESATQFFKLRMETKLYRGKKESAIEFRWTNDPKAPAVTLKEEDVLKNYPMTYRMLTDSLKRRYSNFVENKEYHRIRKEIENENKFCIVRLLNPSNPNSSKQRFYNPNIFQEFDKFYEIRRKTLTK